MKPNDLFIRMLNRGTPQERWEVDSVGNCGEMFFRNVITVVEPTSKNPGIIIQKPMGLRGVKKAVVLIEEFRAKYGLTTLE